MCEPTTIAYIAVAVVSAYTAAETGASARIRDRFNAREQENQATDVLNKGTEDENIHRQKTADFKAKQRAQLAASGIDIDSGSAADIQQDTDLLGEVDALRIRKNAQGQAGTLNRQAELTNAQGDAAARAGNLSAAGSLIGGGAKAYGASTNSASLLGTDSGNAAAGTPLNSKWYTNNSSFAYS